MEAEASVDIGDTDKTPSSVVAPNYAETDDVIRKRIEEAGNEVLQKYCSKRINEPTMIPPIPNLTKYIDKYINPDEDLTEENKSDKKRQEDYGAEVIVYRALERFKRNGMIVLHELKQTNRQYSLFVPEHEYKEEDTNSLSGECDILVINQGAITIIEVCNLSSESKKQRIRTSFDNKKKIQWKRAEKLVKGILKRFDGNVSDTVSDPIICCFFACPNLTRNDVPKDEFTEDEISRFMFKEDMDVLHDWKKLWWAKNVTTTEFSDKTKYLSKILIGLWTIDSQNQCNIEHDCSLGGNILKTDELLRNTDITFGFGRKCKNPFQYNNPNFEPAPDIFKKMKIKNLSKKQHEIFLSQEKFLWINGAAGSGKTILTLGKVIQTVLKNDQKEKDKKAKAVIFVNVDEDKGKDVYKNTLLKAGIQFEVLHFEGEDAEALKDIMSNPTKIRKFINEQGKIISTHLIESVQVVLFDMTAYPTRSAGGSAEGLSFIKEIVLSIMSERNALTKFFVDDEQCLLNTVKRKESVEELEKITNDNEYCEVWICSDIAQTMYPSENQFCPPSTDDITSEYIVALYSREPCLTENFRNTLDIANILSAIRNKMPWPKEQTAGHFIRGPRPTIYFFYAAENLDLVSEKLKEEVDRLVCGDAMKASDIGLICNNIEKTTEIIKQSKINEDIDISSQFKAIHRPDTSSMEWPAVICLMDASLGFYDQMNHLPPEFYHAISRGRVYVTVFWYYTPDPRLQPPKHVGLLKDLYPLANIKEWGDPEARDKIRKAYEQKRVKDEKKALWDLKKRDKDEKKGNGEASKK